MSAAGQFVPAMLIFARKRMKDELMDGGPPGSIGRCRDSGYIDKDLFLEYLQHFVSQVKCSKEQKVLLILNGHTSHTKSIAVIDFASDNGIILMSLPPHTTHRLQPLDTPLFKSVESYYDEAIRQWLRNHPGRAVTTWQVAGLFAEAYGRAATIQTAVNWFRSTGIMPYDPNVIPDHVYAPSDVTDTPMANVTQNAQEPQPSTSSEPQPSMSSHAQNAQELQSSTITQPKNIHEPQPSTSSQLQNAQELQPSTSSEPQPSTSSHAQNTQELQSSTITQPKNIHEPQPSTSSHAQNAQELQPSTSSEPQPSTSSHAQNTQELQPSTSSEPQPSTSSHAQNTQELQPSTSSHA